MRKVVHVCDLCETNMPKTKIKYKYKYKAKRMWFSGGDHGWEKIELCETCLRKIIEEVNNANN